MFNESLTKEKSESLQKDTKTMHETTDAEFFHALSAVGKIRQKSIDGGIGRLIFQVVAFVQHDHRWVADQEFTLRDSE